MIYLKLIIEQLYFQIQDFNLIDQHKHTGEIIKLFNKHETNSTKIILNIKVKLYKRPQFSHVKVGDVSLVDSAEFVYDLNKKGKNK